MTLMLEELCLMAIILNNMIYNGSDHKLAMLDNSLAYLKEPFKIIWELEKIMQHKHKYIKH